MERDDIIEYSLDSHHSEEEGAKIRRNIWMVTLFLAVVTTIEVTLGAYWKDWFEPSAWNTIKWTYVVLTMIKAGYIVMSFMHLGEERKNIRMIILAPYVFFILYLLYIGLTESNYVHQMWENFL